MRKWWLSLPLHQNVDEQKSRVACIELTRLAFHDAKRCVQCASQVVTGEDGKHRCLKCGFSS